MSYLFAIHGFQICKYCICSFTDSVGFESKSSTAENILKTSAICDSNQKLSDELKDRKSPNKNALPEVSVKALKELFPTISSLVKLCHICSQRHKIVD